MLASKVEDNRENVKTLYINHICSRQKEKVKESSVTTNFMEGLGWRFENMIMDM